jgi:hypothetical protein
MVDAYSLLALAAGLLLGWWLHNYATRDAKMRRENRILRQRVCRLEQSLKQSECQKYGQI